MGQTFSQQLKQELDMMDKPKVHPIPLSREREVLAKALGIDTDHNYNIAIVGGTGVGKSSLINSVRGLALVEGDDEFAKVNEVECTTEITGYVHPEFKAIVLWDIPGGASPTFKSETYFKDQYLDAFDFLVIVVPNTLRQLDVQVAKEAIENEVPFVFVRTKIDQDIDQKVKRTRKSYADAKDVLWRELIQSMDKQLEKYGIIANSYFVSENGFNVHDEHWNDYRMDEAKLLKMVLTISYGRRQAFQRSQIKRF